MHFFSQDTAIKIYKNGEMESRNLEGVYTRGVTLFCGGHVYCNVAIF